MSESEDDDFSDWIEDEQPCRSLFEDRSFPSARDALRYDAVTYGFEAPTVAAAKGLDFYEYLRLVNWIRSARRTPEEAQSIEKTASCLRDDRYLQPVLEDDPLLQIDYDDILASRLLDKKGKAPASDDSQQLKDLEGRYQDLQTAYGELQELARDALFAKSSDPPGPSHLPARDDDTHYFRSYANNEIHESMLKDAVRTDAYRDFILGNPGLFQGKVVLDVGCGTGILSLFAAKAGAKKVYAVDASAVALQARQIVFENGMDHIISVMHGKIEDILLPEQVDVIVSEWMGYFLLYESMLDSVLHARDRFLKPGGLIAPSQCSLLLSGGEDLDLLKERVDFWQDVYGFRMTAMQREMYDDALIDVVASDSLLFDTTPIQDVHMPSITLSSIDFTSTFTLNCRKSGTLRFFCAYFDTFFTHDGRQVESISTGSQPQPLLSGELRFTTGPHGTKTHWAQTLFLLREPIAVQAGDSLRGSLSVYKASDNARELVVEITVRDVDDRKQSWNVR